MSITGLAILLMAAEWVLLVAGTRLHEMIVGAASIAAAYVFLFFVYRSTKLDVELRAADLVAGWRLPGYIAIDTWVVVKVLVQDLLSIQKASSFYRVCCFESSRGGAQLMGRRVLATVYTTASPNTIVIGVDSKQNRMLFHQLQRSGLSKMDRALGCRPCKSG